VAGNIGDNHRAPEISAEVADSIKLTRRNDKRRAWRK